MRFALCVDGHDGSGKTTAVSQVVSLANRMLGIPVYTFKFPTSYPDEGTPNEERAEFHLRDFEEHLPEVADTADRDCLIVFDRSFMSTAAYQGYSDGGQDGIQEEPILNDIIKRGYLAFAEYFDYMRMVRVYCHPMEAYNRLKKRSLEGTDVIVDETEQMVQDNLERFKLVHRVHDLAQRARMAEERLTNVVVGLSTTGEQLPALVRLGQIDTTGKFPNVVATELFRIACVDIACEYGV